VVVFRDISLVVLLVTIIDSILEVPRRLINFPTESSQGFFSSSFNFMKFIPNVFFGMPRVFQEDVSLFRVLLLLVLFKTSGIILDT